VNEKRLRGFILFLALNQLALGAWQAIAPGTFFEAVADFGERNDHYLRDVSTLYLALGVALIAAMDRSSWRVPVLFFAALQYGLHSINHLIDIGDADPGWIGPFDFVSLALFTSALVFALRESRRQPA
jgi:hypothetical protein